MPFPIYESKDQIPAGAEDVYEEKDGKFVPKLPDVSQLETTLAKVHASAAWKDYMARNMYEDVYMNADEMTRWLVSEQGEITRFLTDMGLVVKK